MTTPRRLEQDLPALLADLYLAGIPDYRDDLVRQVARTPQRSAWTFPERWLPMDLATQRVPVTRFPMRALGILALVGFLIAASVAVYIGAQAKLPEPFGPAVTGLHVYSRLGDVFTRDGVDGAERVLFAGDAFEVAVAPSLDGTQLLSLQEVGGGVDLYVSSIDGSDRIKVAGPIADVGRMEWSPDGSTIAVAHGVADAGAILLVAADGSGNRPLDVGMPAGEPTWRPPDGRQLAFRGLVDGNWALFLVDADGLSGPRLLDVERDLLQVGYEVMDLAWSPNGDRIAYHRLVLTPGEGNGNGFRIAVGTVDPTGSLVQDETFTFADASDDEFHPVWTPNGQRLVYARREGSADTVAMAEPVAGATATEFDANSTGTDGIWFTITPDGRQIAVHYGGTNADRLVDIETGAVSSMESTDDGYAFQRLAP